jgi:hypothetical protein
MGGQRSLKQAMYLFRLLGNIQSTSQTCPDDVIVSIDLEVSRVERAAMLKDPYHLPFVNELGIATLDVRHIFSPSSPKQPHCSRRILTQQHSAHRTSEDFEDCDVIDFKECVFAKTKQIQQADIVPTVERCLQHPSNELSLTCTEHRHRPVFLVGHSIQHDLNVLKRLGLDLTHSCRVIGIIDSHSLSRHILPSGPYTLGAVLSRLGCPHEAYELHNAGNDATYTLLADLLLSVKWADQRQLNEDHTSNRRLIESFVKLEIEAPRWVPVRGALGAHQQALSIP